MVPVRASPCRAGTRPPSAAAEPGVRCSTFYKKNYTTSLRSVSGVVMKKAHILLTILLCISFIAQIYAFDFLIITDGNEELPFQIKSDYPDGSGKIYLYSMAGQKLHLISKVSFDADMQHVSVLFDDGESVRYKKLQPEIKKYLVVDINNQVYVLVKRKVGLFKPKWTLHPFNSDYPLITFENVESNAQVNHFYATLTSGEVIEYTLAEEHPITPMLNIPKIGIYSGASFQH